MSRPSWRKLRDPTLELMNMFSSGKVMSLPSFAWFEVFRISKNYHWIFLSFPKPISYCENDDAFLLTKTLTSALCDHGKKKKEWMQFSKKIFKFYCQFKIIEHLSCYKNFHMKTVVISCSSFVGWLKWTFYRTSGKRFRRTLFSNYSDTC